MARGHKALAGQEEEDIPSHFFPANSTPDLTIYFKGVYLLIVNKETNDVKTHIGNETNRWRKGDCHETTPSGLKP
ncbi:hypothetical protein PMIN03_012245 [Paraphaeosphaeria minitans]